MRFAHAQEMKTLRRMSRSSGSSRRVGEMALDMDIIKEAMKGRPFAPKTWEE